MEKVLGMTLQQVEALDHTELIDELGREVVESRLSCATLALDTLRASLREYPSHKATGRKWGQPLVLAQAVRTE